MNRLMAFLVLSAVLIVTPGPDMVLVAKNALFYNAMSVAWLLAYAIVASGASSLLRRPGVKVVLDRVTGFVLIGFGVRLATERS